MALTPDDVVTKQFQHVRFKEGFDPDEVDDFLDEIVVEWRKTIAENEELKAEADRLRAEIDELKAQAEQGVAAVTGPVFEQPAPAEEETPVAVFAPEPAAAPTADNPATTSAGIIELAQRLHDEYVADGQAQRDKLISEARTQATSIVDEAVEKARAEHDRLETDRVSLEARINDLRQFERDYRSQLRATLEEKLRDLDVANA
ncbi:DivIVA domain-containing protein [Microbacterium sp. No. 7]|uniref:DivIVA domain-containing protein n=1 Tax=Microbacterium sp. No. 7 TaxID=1714373 RepID=UPI0006D0DE79|nr:DivIVA domain-containing protein [Microbacterium sp. No. 7]ALJ20800.1 cell division protein [Microbacterium sp. No. 7]